MKAKTTRGGALRARVSRRAAALALVLGLGVLLQPWIGPPSSRSSGQPGQARSGQIQSSQIRSSQARQKAVASPPTRFPSTSRLQATPPLGIEPAVRVDRATAPPVRPGVPARLVVPKLHVDAPVVPIAAPGGVLLPPSNPQTLGWWHDGAKPGAATGSALITGHTVHTGGGAFDDLETLVRGDSVRVVTRGGSLRYVVSTVRVYRKSTLARDAQRLFSQRVPGRLVLITCEDWNGSTYLSNAVVVAVPR